MKRLLACTLMIAATAQIAAAGIVYATASNGETNLFGTLDLSTGVFSSIADLPVPVPGAYKTALTAGADGTLYAADTRINTVSGSGALLPFGSVTAPDNGAGPGFPFPSSFWGLASQGGSGFFADNWNLGPSGMALTYTFFHISSNGSTITTLPVTSAEYPGLASGNLSFGPDGNLYFSVPTFYDPVASVGASSRFTVNTTTGALTLVGSGLQTLTGNPLTLTTYGGALYGVDTYATTDRGIYSVSTLTGEASLIGVVSGLPDGFTIDTLAAVPEPGTIGLCILGLLTLVSMRRCVR